MKHGVITLALAALTLAGCGGSSAAPTASSPSSSSGAAVPGAVASAPLPPGAGCAETVADTLGRVALAVYTQAASGANAAAALRGAQASLALRMAVMARDASATRAAAAPALNGPTVRVRVQAGGRMLADLGVTPALAPTGALLRGPGGQPIGQVTVSVQGQAQYAATLRRLTGAPVLLGTDVPAPGASAKPPSAGTQTGALAQHAIRYQGRSYRMVSFAGRAFPGATLAIAVLAPARPAPALCGPTSADARAATVAAVARRIYAQELASGEVTAALTYVKRSRPFADAVARADPAATRAAIKTFFQTRIHIVRVRAFRGSALVTDLGGPHVLAPVPGALPGGGRPPGHFLLAIQDDAGYVKLVRRFTGADALLIDHGKVVASSLTPAPSGVPARGSARIGARSYRVHSFPVAAFPSGTLQASILVPEQP